MTALFGSNGEPKYPPNGSCSAPLLWSCTTSANRKVAEVELKSVIRLPVTGFGNAGSLHRWRLYAYPAVSPLYTLVTG